MRIYAGQTANLFQVGEMNPAMNRKHMNQTQQAAAGMRSDTAVISPQGKSSSILANLMNQKELIQMNKESLIKRSLDEETGTISSGLQEQLEEYEEKLEELDQQIASEMAKQAENKTENNTEPDNTYQKPQDAGALEPVDERMAGLTELSSNLDKAQTVEQVRMKLDGDKKVCESEMQSGSAVAKYKLDRIEEKERLAEKLEPLLNLFRL